MVGDLALKRESQFTLPDIEYRLNQPLTPKKIGGSLFLFFFFAKRLMPTIQSANLLSIFLTKFVIFDM